MKTKKRGLLATVGAFAAAATLALGGTVVANAATGGPGADGPLVLPGTGGEPITGTVTIHKLEQGDTPGTPATGLEQEVQGSGIPGVTFTAQQVESVTVGTGPEAETYMFDLSTNEGWQNAAKLTYTGAGWQFDEASVTSVDYGEVVTKTTGAVTYENAVFADLPIGVYLFTETVTPDGVIGAAPWVMTVPLTHPTSLNSWLYGIHVYPKNDTQSVTKTVADADAIKVGDDVTWTITGSIPLVGNPDFDSASEVSADNLKFLPPTKYIITDDLDSRLTPLTTDPVTLALSGDTGVTLYSGDYGIEWDPISAGAGAKLTITFTSEGLKKLALAVSQATTPSSVKVVTTLKTTVTEVEFDDGVCVPEGESQVAAPGGCGIVGDGVIENEATIDNGATVTSEPATSKFGDILIEKVDATNRETKLGDVEFKVYATEADAKAGTDPITVAGESTFTTNADGIVRISGLRVSGWANGTTVEPSDPGYRTYWLVETKAAPGYELLAKPIEVIVTQTNQILTSATQIKNVPHNAGFTLPLTGGTGTLLLTVGGIALLATVLVVARRRRSAEAAE